MSSHNGGIGEDLVESFYYLLEMYEYVLCLVEWKGEKLVDQKDLIS